ncbi:hypothetical protein BAE44_0025913 [Dichanthelium oligosanthes]|uniref:Uncharacterized protein n=1 Tax=Dichanthelium oligosanthes TaxID=888268 RepID=A0A1E5UJT0_9POAL|nr:hypothetical protein BAE44_0025913 [Dichanthelium oligosanthes]
MEGAGHSTTSSHRALRRVTTSRKALRIGSPGPYGVWAMGFLSSVCIAYLFGYVLLLPPKGFTQSSLTTKIGTAQSNINKRVNSSCGTRQTPNENAWITEARITHLFNAWSALLNTTSDDVLKRPDVPRPPHLENCRLNVEKNKKSYGQGDDGGAFPRWTLWKGSLGLELFDPALHAKKGVGAANASPGGQYPPWIAGSDEENYPQTRRVQMDIWVHQQPPDCRDPSLQFLVADWERLPRLGIGAQIVAISGLLAIAMKEKRIVVTRYYNRADHDGCKGASRSCWSCYFFQETSPDCQKRAFELVRSNASLANGVVRVKEMSYNSKKIWAVDIHRFHSISATRYLMRFPTEHMCGLLNSARHSAFGMQAAKLVLESIQNYSPEEVIDDTELYPDWSFHFTHIARQRGNLSMAAYMASLGRESSTNCALINFMMATEADFLVGALGSN